MKKHETYKRNNNTDMQKQNKNTNKIADRHSPHNGYKYKSLFIIIKSAMNVLVFKIR